MKSWWQMVLLAACACEHSSSTTPDSAVDAARDAPVTVTYQFTVVRQEPFIAEGRTFPGQLAPRLRELCDPRLLLFENTSNVVSGAQMVATAVNAVWRTHFTAANIGAGLASGLPTQ